MATTVDWPTGIISVPRADMTLVQSSPFEVRELDLDQFRKDLRALEDSENGRPSPLTHSYNGTYTLAGDVYADAVLLNTVYYSVTFEDGQYAVNLEGANSNVGDVVNLNQVSVRSKNTAGKIVITSGSGLSASEQQQLTDIEKRVKSDAVHDDTTVTLYEEGSATVIVTKDVVTAGDAGLSAGDSVSIRKP